MSHRPLDGARMRKALGMLDKAIDKPCHLIVGGGAAMVLAYDHPLATQDVDAFAAKGSVSLAELDRHAKAIGRTLGVAPDWLNGHFYTYTIVLPSDYTTRLRSVFEGKQLRVDALGPEDLLIMKCFAGRDKDRPHARKLLGHAADLRVVDEQLSTLAKAGHPAAERAADYFDDLRDEAGL